MSDLDRLIDRRNDILFACEEKGLGREGWQRLGVANRHFERIIGGVLTLSPAVEREIVKCLERAEEWIGAG